MYAAQLYHCMLTEDLSEKIERLQRIVLRIIYPPGTSYRAALAMANLPRLRDMREEMCNKKFARKTSTNPPPVHNLRKTSTFAEEAAKTERMKKSPL